MEKKVFGLLILGSFAIVIFLGNKTKSNFADKNLTGIMAINIANAEVNYNNCRTETNRFCYNAGNAIAGCDNSAWYQRDNCTQ